MKPIYYTFFSALVYFSTYILSHANLSVEPDYAMTAENVLIGCSGTGILVSGNYSFNKIQNDKEAGRAQKRSLSIKLPVPTPKNIKKTEGLIELFNPKLTCKDKEYRPKYESNGVNIITETEVIKNANIAIFKFDIFPEELDGKETIFTVEYNQPIIEIEKKAYAAYIPFIPHAGQMKLDKEAFIISFEARDNAKLQLSNPLNYKIIQEKPTFVSINAESGNYIFVEIISPPGKSTPREQRSAITISENTAE